MVLLLRLLPWLRRRPPVPPAPVPERPAAGVPADEDEALDAEVMRRRVRHFCEESPPPSRTRR